MVFFLGGLTEIPTNIAGIRLHPLLVPFPFPFPWARGHGRSPFLTEVNFSGLMLYVYIVYLYMVTTYVMSNK